MSFLSCSSLSSFSALSFEISTENIAFSCRTSSSACWATANRSRSVNVRLTFCCCRLRFSRFNFSINARMRGLSCRSGICSFGSCEATKSKRRKSDFSSFSDSLCVNRASEMLLAPSGPIELTVEGNKISSEDHINEGCSQQ